MFSAGSEEFAAMSFFLDLLEGTADISDAPEVETFWSGITMADGRATLRRAAMIMGGELPTAADFDNAAASEAGLRQELRELMQGNGFHEFLVEGANDRLLTDRWISYELYNQIIARIHGPVAGTTPPRSGRPIYARSTTVAPARRPN